MRLRRHNRSRLKLGFRLKQGVHALVTMRRYLFLSGAERKALFRQYPARSLALLFVGLALLGGLILRLPICSQGAPLDWSSAYFTATSAVCVIGLSVFDVSTTLTPFGQFMLLVLLQIGGLGYMLTSTFLLLFFGKEPRLRERLLLRSTLGKVNLRDTKTLVLRAVAFTFFLEAVGAVILTLRFLSMPEYSWPRAIWHGVFHSVAAFCNSGFDLFGVGENGQSSLRHFQDDWILQLTIAALIIFGGLGFAVYQELLQRWRYKSLRRTPLSLHSRIVLSMTVLLLGVGTVSILVTEWTNPHTLGALSLPEKFLAGFFQSATLRTAGYSTLDFGAMRSITLLLAGMWMFIGAAPGGTSGGVKVTTFAVMLATVTASLRGRSDVEIFGRRLATETVYRAQVLIFVSLAVVVAGVFLLTFTEPDGLIAAGIKENLFVRLQFEVLSAFGTTGVSTGITSYLSHPGRIILIVIMFIGRLGPITAATALAAPQSQPRRRLPEEEIALG